MSDEPENIVLAYLRRLDAKVDTVIQKQDETILRVPRIEAGLARVRQDQGSDAEYVAQLRAEVDRLGKEVDRIDRRLDLTDA
ncbi:hypothetical protein [Rhodospira trueperi]|uniref:Uncharacterized protein n=1 Tax=Rhodospira trueperi TaxID=69960 RepID=A0A1G7D633_9PROT|nr:hypothetical protein [Rhodospira trueperi]SDE47088.1 hypothetical protein SAMN05421720_10754 [Rhodospira trueperi]